MSAGTKVTFPFIPAKQWWELRRQFVRRMPAREVDGEYLSTTLNMTPQSARANALPGLKAMGLVDEDGKTTERALRWRDDEEYPSVCEEIRNEVYPPELLDAYPGPEIDRQRLQRWFQQRTRSGESAATKMAATFELLRVADPTAETVAKPRVSPPKGNRQNTSKTNATNANAVEKAVESTERAETARAEAATLPRRPSLHIDIQIHISPESSAQQIDDIFASMAKHLNLNESSDVD